MTGWEIVRRALAAALVATGLAACDDGELLTPVPLASLTGVWTREWPVPPPNADQPPPQWLVFLDEGRYQLLSGNLVSVTGGVPVEPVGWVEHGRVREQAGRLQWSVDSIETFLPAMPSAPARRIVQRDVIHIEGHPFANASARRSGDLLVLSGRNASIGAPAGFTARFRRAGGLAATDVR